MTAVQELNRRLQELPESEREAMAAALLEEMDAQAWDRQIEADYDAGRLDQLIEEAKADIAAGRTREL